MTVDFNTEISLYDAIKSNARSEAASSVANSFESALIKAQLAEEQSGQAEQATSSVSSGLNLDGSTALMMCMMIGNGGMESGVSEILSMILMQLLTKSGAAENETIRTQYSGKLGGGGKTVEEEQDLTEVVKSAMTRLGDPYSQKKAGQGDYTDCSYLSRWCYDEIGIDLPRTAAAQGKYCVDNDMTITKEELQPGDLVFFSLKKNGRFMNISHVGIYAGDGKMVDASSLNGKVVYRDLIDGQVLYGRPGKV